MEIGKALNILQALSDGVNPYTGEILSTDSVCQNPQTVRALCCAIRALERKEDRELSKKRLPENAGEPWSETEDQRIRDEFRNGANVRTIAQAHHRTTSAIVARLTKLGLMPPNKNRG
jgi:hypothetical protein